MNQTPRLGRLPLVLGYAGLLPQIVVVLLLLSGDLTARFTALALGFAYASLILSFLGGVWWGLGAARPDRAPPWLWIAAVVPTLVALGAAWPWMVGSPWPQPSLIGLGVAGRRASDVTAAALTEVRGAAFPVPTAPTAPTWGRWWRVTRAIPFGSRAVRVTRNIDYWGDGDRRHRLDVYRSRLAPPGKAPVMVYIHGGSYSSSSSNGEDPVISAISRAWASTRPMSSAFCSPVEASRAGMFLGA